MTRSSVPETQTFLSPASQGETALCTNSWGTLCQQDGMHPLTLAAYSGTQATAWFLTCAVTRNNGSTLAMCSDGKQLSDLKPWLDMAILCSVQWLLLFGSYWLGRTRDGIVNFFKKMNVCIETFWAELKKNKHRCCLLHIIQRNLVVWLWKCGIQRNLQWLWWEGYRLGVLPYAIYLALPSWFRKHRSN